jgi:hypothetical protein
MSTREGYRTKAQSTLCGDRKTCEQCHNDGKSSEGICYWCKDKGCKSPDDYYDSTCSSDLADCQNLNKTGSLLTVGRTF